MNILVLIVVIVAVLVSLGTVAIVAGYANRIDYPVLRHLQSRLRSVTTGRGRLWLWGIGIVLGLLVLRFIVPLVFRGLANVFSSFQQWLVTVTLPIAKLYSPERPLQLTVTILVTASVVLLLINFGFFHLIGRQIPRLWRRNRARTTETETTSPQRRPAPNVGQLPGLLGMICLFTAFILGIGLMPAEAKPHAIVWFQSLGIVGFAIGVLVLTGGFSVIYTGVLKRSSKPIWVIGIVTLLILFFMFHFHPRDAFGAEVEASFVPQNPSLVTYEGHPYYWLVAWSLIIITLLVCLVRRTGFRKSLSIGLSGIIFAYVLQFFLNIVPYGLVYNQYTQALRSPDDVSESMGGWLGYYVPADSFIVLITAQRDTRSVELPIGARVTFLEVTGAIKGSAKIGDYVQADNMYHLPVNIFERARQIEPARWRNSEVPKMRPVAWIERDGYLNNPVTQAVSAEAGNSYIVEKAGRLMLGPNIYNALPFEDNNPNRASYLDGRVQVRVRIEYRIPIFILSSFSKGVMTHRVVTPVFLCQKTNKNRVRAPLVP